LASNVGIAVRIEIRKNDQGTSPAISQTVKLPAWPLPKAGGAVRKITEKTSV
jgi:hypothetical protein